MPLYLYRYLYCCYYRLVVTLNANVLLFYLQHRDKFFRLKLAFLYSFSGLNGETGRFSRENTSTHTDESVKYARIHVTMYTELDTRRHACTRVHHDRSDTQAEAPARTHTNSHTKHNDRRARIRNDNDTRKAIHAYNYKEKRQGHCFTNFLW